MNICQKMPTRTQKSTLTYPHVPLVKKIAYITVFNTLIIDNSEYFPDDAHTYLKVDLNLPTRTLNNAQNRFKSSFEGSKFHLVAKKLPILQFLIR